MNRIEIGASDTARAFGASVNVSIPQRGLYLVAGRHRSPDVLVRSCGGQTLVRFPDTFKVLAVLPVETFLAFQRHPEIALVGPVAINPERFARFAALAGLDPDGDGEIG